MNKSFFICITLYLLFITTQISAEPSVERGEYLVRGPAACGVCHTPMGPLTKKKNDRRMGPVPGMELAGNVWEEEGMQITVANLTPGGRIATWTDDEIIRVIREGMLPDGSLLLPMMPFPLYRHLSDTDVKSIILFLRSLPAVKNDLPPTKHNMPLPPSWGTPVGYVADIPATNTLEYGAYLAGPVAHCIACHTPMSKEDLMKLFVNPPDFKGLMALPSLGQGGEEMHGPWGMSVSANITSDPTALGRYTDLEVKKMIIEGLHPSGMKLMPPMPYDYYAKMTDADLDSLITYLRTIPAHPVSD